MVKVAACWSRMPSWPRAPGRARRRDSPAGASRRPDLPAWYAVIKVHSNGPDEDVCCQSAPMHAVSWSIWYTY